MKKRFILTIIFISSIFFSFAQVWYKQDLANLASVNFPSQPAIIDTSGQRMFRYSDQDAYYIVVAKDLSESGPQFKEGELDKFYEGIINGIISASGGKLIGKKQFEITGLKGEEIEFTSSSNPALYDLRFKRILFFNNTLFFIDFWTPSQNEMATEGERNKYFNSFTIIADSASLKQYSISDKDKFYKIGYIIMEILGGLLVIAIIVRIRSLIIKRIKRQNHLRTN